MRSDEHNDLSNNFFYKFFDQECNISDSDVNLRLAAETEKHKSKSTISISVMIDFNKPGIAITELFVSASNNHGEDLKCSCKIRNTR